MKRQIDDNPWPGTVEFIHPVDGTVVKRCYQSELPHPLPNEYRIPLFRAMSTQFDQGNEEFYGSPVRTGSAVYRLHRVNGRPAYLFHRIE